MNLTPEQVRSILGVPAGESVDRAFEFIKRWQEMRLKKAWGNLSRPKLKAPKKEKRRQIIA